MKHTFVQKMKPNLLLYSLISVKRKLKLQLKFKITKYNLEKVEGILMNSLIKRAMAHDVDAFVQLMEENANSMYKIARSYLNNDEDIADAIQDTILNCLEKISTLREPKYFKTWMIRILINNCNDILKEKKRETCYEELPVTLKSNNTTADSLEFKDILDKLDEKYKTVILLYYVEDLKVSEISRLLNMNISTVKTRLSRGREQLRKLYGIETTKPQKPRKIFPLQEVTKYAR